MGVVYEAEVLGIDGFHKRMALKRLLSRWTSDKRFVQLFRDEANLVCNLVHEHIAQVHFFGRDESGYFILSEFVDGLSLQQIMDHAARFHRPVPWRLAVHMASRIARGLAYAHGCMDRQGHPLGIVHRDVSPTNVLLSILGQPKIIDFGIAKAVNQTVIGDRWLTGKVCTMSPEQAALRPVDHRSDQYSLGALLFQLLSGECIRPPDSDPMRHDFAALRPPWNAIPGEVSEDALTALRRLLSPRPEQRYERTSEVARTLEMVIYKDGYGPTVESVEAWLRQEHASLYASPPAVSRASDETLVEER